MVNLGLQIGENLCKHIILIQALNRVRKASFFWVHYVIVEVAENKT